MVILLFKLWRPDHPADDREITRMIAGRVMPNTVGAHAPSGAGRALIRSGECGFPVLFMAGWTCRALREIPRRRTAAW
jgi:hypothetical protein